MTNFPPQKKKKKKKSREIQSWFGNLVPLCIERKEITMKNTSRYFGTGRRRGFEESLISDDDERSGADEAGHAMRLPSAASSSSSSSSVPPQGYGSAAASDFSEYSAYEGESELLSDREITRKLRVGGRHSGSQEENENRIDVKIWAVRSLAVILAVSMIFVVSMQQSNLTSSESITSNGVNSEAEPKVSDLMASNLPPNVSHPSHYLHHHQYISES